MSNHICIIGIIVGDSNDGYASMITYTLFQKKVIIMPFSNESYSPTISLTNKIIN